MELCNNRRCSPYFVSVFTQPAPLMRRLSNVIHMYILLLYMFIVGFYAGASSGKRNVTVQRPSVRRSVCLSCRHTRRDSTDQHATWPVYISTGQ